LLEEGPGCVNIYGVHTEREAYELEKLPVRAGDVKMAVILFVRVFRVSGKDLVCHSREEIELSRGRMNLRMVGGHRPVSAKNQADAGIGRDGAAAFPVFVALK